MYQLLESTSLLPRDFRKEWLRAQGLNGRHIERYLSTYFSPNTHMLGEAAALLFLGTLCPELSRAEHWKSRGWKIVLQEAQRQIEADGFHFEQSTYYHLYAIDFFFHAAILAGINEFAIPNEFETTLEKMWKQFAHAKVEQWIKGETFDLFVGSHDGYERLVSRVMHRRWVVGLKSGLFLVRDIASGTGKHRLDITWHLGAEMQLCAENLFGVKNTSSGLAFLCVEKHGWSEAVRKDAWAPVYGKKEAITVLNFGALASLPAEFVTLLVPLEEVRAMLGGLAHMSREAATPVKAYLYSTPTEECSFFFAEARRPWNQGKLARDAEFVCWQKKREGEDELLIFCNGSYVDVDGNRILGCKRTISHCEMSSRGGRREIHASEPNALESK
jgi:hypothetical protein